MLTPSWAFSMASFKTQFQPLPLHHEGTNQLLSSVQFFGPWHCSSLSRNADTILSKGWRTTWKIAILMNRLTMTRCYHNQQHNHCHHRHNFIIVIAIKTVSNHQQIGCPLLPSNLQISIWNSFVWIGQCLPIFTNVQYQITTITWYI